MPEDAFPDHAPRCFAGVRALDTVTGIIRAVTEKKHYTRTPEPDPQTMYHKGAFSL